METKICSKCKEEKTVTEFYINPQNKKYRAACITCFKNICHTYREKNKDKVKEYHKKYREENQNSIKEKGKIYREKNKDLIKSRQKIKSKKYYEKNRDIIIEKSREFRKKNPEYSKEYRLKNPKYNNEYRKKRVIVDHQFKLSYTLRSRLHIFFTKNNITKKNKTFDIVGCTPQFLKEHMEKQFKDGMTWENYGFYGWHIDHIIPLSSAKTDEELYKLCHYSNLQPLWANENLSKGSKIL
jgi:hypothetical protein